MASHKVVGTIVKCRTFKKGDVICAVKARNEGLEIWFRASTWDVKEWSGKQQYYKLKFE